MLPETDEHKQMRELLLENQRLLTENNQLLKKMNKRSLISFWFRVAWTLILIGAPFVVYYYVVEPYFTSLGSSFQIFQSGLQEVPGWKQFYQAIGGGAEAGNTGAGSVVE
ncbi:hypothetical protein H6778_00430 [Candidatus Nomurabacteria bacterium]|nr:hypothetical protein [Candidatus Nomurabacteria bacterium]